MIGFQTLLYKEVLRFWKVSAQTITAPILTAILYLVIFGHALEDRVQVYPGVSYVAFLVLKGTASAILHRPDDVPRQLDRADRVFDRYGV